MIVTVLQTYSEPQKWLNFGDIWSPYFFDKKINCILNTWLILLVRFWRSFTWLRHVCFYLVFCVLVDSMIRYDGESISQTGGGVFPRTQFHNWVSLLIVTADEEFWAMTEIICSRYQSAGRSLQCHMNGWPAACVDC